MANLFSHLPRVASMRRRFCDMKPDENGMLEIVNASFVVDEPAIFGEPNEDWHRRELEWYLSQSLSVEDIPPPIPKIWDQVAGDDRMITSNYGWCIFSEENKLQFWRAVGALVHDRYSRQAVMIYTRPSMHEDWNLHGRRDFMCTNTVQLLIRGDELHYIVHMRSNDAVFGFKGDSAWHRWVHQKALHNLVDAGVENLTLGTMVWNATSLHVYPRHFGLVNDAWEKS